MNASEVEVGQPVLLELCTFDRSSFGADIPEKAEVNIRASPTIDEALLTWEAQSWEVVGVDDQSQRELAELIGTSRAHLCWLVHRRMPKDDAEVLSIQVRRLLEARVEAQPIVVGVTDMVIEKIRQDGLRGQSIPVTEIVTWLNERLILGEGGTARILISGSPRPHVGLENAFRTYGDGIMADVGRGHDGEWRVTSVLRLRQNQPDEQRPITILQVPIRFDDATVAGRYRNQARTELDLIANEADSYLSLWQRYNAIEGRNIVRRARDFSWLRYTSRRHLPTGEWRFSLAQADAEREILADLAQRYQVDLEAGSQPPRNLQQIEESIEEETAGVADAAELYALKQRRFVGECSRVDLTTLSVDLHPLEQEEAVRPPDHGVLYIAQHGDETRLTRREDAWRRIRSAEVPIPWLGQLLAGQPTPHREQPRLRKFPLKSELRQIFGADPTPIQIKALQVALNTPDIALIQGPPGTGKTKLIAALESILAKLEPSENAPKLTLLTSYQHDAVEHAASQTVVMGLPAVKVGRRRGRPGGDTNDQWIKDWRTKRAEEVQAQLDLLPDQPLAHALREVQKRKLAYDRQPGTDSDAAQCLREVLDLSEMLVPGGLRDRLADLYLRLRRPDFESTADDAGQILKYVRGLRTNAASFQDDGPARAAGLLTYAKLTVLGLTEADSALLRRAADWRDEQPPFLEALAELQQRLLEQAQAAAAPVSRAGLHNREVAVLLTDVVDTMYERALTRSPGIELALAEYLDDLTQDPYGVRQAIEQCTAVLASTCQQVDGRQMHFRMGNDEFIFRSVIVDEAARANPLDLFIPMARAERRIILVGDHRQLPQILDPDVERELEASSASTQELLRDSLFHRLFEDLKQRQAQDGLVRAVTLDTQFRMHPILGRFVSDTFYAPYDEAFESRRPASEFEHNIEHFQGRIAGWIDVPHFLGPERGGQSKRRPVEARRLAQEVRRIRDEHPDLSVGVITFYSAQVTDLLEALKREGLADDTGDGIEVRDRSQLRVGTVDAFQGMEFDVVLLSLTRSNREPLGDKRALRRKYGFLTLENRLCVAMSRQKRLLIVVGDASMVEAAAGLDDLRGLSAFWALCGSEHGIRI